MDAFVSVTVLLVSTAGICIGYDNPCDNLNITSETIAIQWRPDTPPHTLCKCRVSSETRQAFIFLPSSPFLNKSLQHSSILTIDFPDNSNSKRVIDPTDEEFILMAKDIIVMFEVKENRSLARQTLGISGEGTFQMICEGARNTSEGHPGGEVTTSGGAGLSASATAGVLCAIVVVMIAGVVFWKYSVSQDSRIPQTEDKLYGDARTIELKASPPTTRKWSNASNVGPYDESWDGARPQDPPAAAANVAAVAGDIRDDEVIYSTPEEVDVSVHAAENAECSPTIESCKDNAEVHYSTPNDHDLQDPRDTN